MEKCLFLLPIKNVHPSEKIKASKSKKLDGITIAYGITGSIAAVESVKIARELIRHGADVVAIMSRDATDIITPDALKFATGRDAIHKLTGNVEHLMDADLLLIAPCTANTLAKVVNGIADNPITTFALAAKKILIAPSMDEKMYANKTVKNNLKMAEKMGITIIPPKVEEGKAKMADMETITEYVIRSMRMERNKNILVIGGYTMEAIDDVRVIANNSSGRMANAIIREVFERFHEMEAWCGNIDCPPYVKTKRFRSIDDLISLIKKMKKYDIIINCAAISDFTVDKRKGKISSGREHEIILKPAPRINKMLRNNTDKLVIFKLDEKKNLLKKAMERLNSDNADIVVANTLKSMGESTGEAWIIDKSMDIKAHVKGSKEKIAKELIDAI